MLLNVIVLDFAIGLVLALGCAAIAAILTGVARFAEWRGAQGSPDSARCHSGTT